LFYFSFCFVYLFFGFVFCIIRRVMNIQEKFEDTKEVISNSVNQRRADNTMIKRKRTKGQTTIYKTYTYN
jgi:hypothetical protein